MNNGGDAAEQVVRLSLEGFEVAARLSGSAAKNIALLLVSVLKQEQKTKGKARLTNMIKSVCRSGTWTRTAFHQQRKLQPQGYGLSGSVYRIYDLQEVWRRYTEFCN